MAWPYYNNQQIYFKVREWFVSWQPWQQKMLLNGITNRSVISEEKKPQNKCEIVRNLRIDIRLRTT